MSEEQKQKLDVDVSGSPDQPTQQEIDDQTRLAEMQMDSIREHRVTLDGLGHIIRNIPGDSLEKINAYNCIMQARAWFREALEYNGNIPLNMKLMNKVTEIESDDDRSDPIKVQVRKKEGNRPETLEDANDIQSLGHVKIALGNLVNKLGILSLITDTIYETVIFTNLREASFWVDREMFRLKDKYKQNLYAQTSQGKRELPKRPQKQKPIVVGGRIESIKPDLRKDVEQPELKIKRQDNEADNKDTKS